MRYLGIDPGVSGGMVLLDGEAILPCPMPTTEQERCSWLRKQCWTNSPNGPVVACIEAISPGFGSQGTGKVQMAKLYGSYRELRAYLVALGVEFQAVRAATVHETLGIPPRKSTLDESDTDWKNRLKAHAQSLYPNLYITLGTADALLLAHYMRITHASTARVH